MPSPDESEARTRKLRIDKRLKHAGWAVVKFAAGRSLAAYDRKAVEEFETANGPADYALVAGGRVLGIVEGKKRAVGPQNALSQAGRYSKGVADSPFNFDGFRVPFLYSSNGDVIWHRDARHEMNLSRPLARFHTPEALLEMIDRDADKAAGWLAAHQDWNERLRPYQIDANKAIERRHHKALADIISAAKLALRQTDEVLTAQERVMRAFERVVAGRTFTEEQEKWLDRIREHMIVNLSIDPEDFDNVPIFAREGGWANADRVFEGRLKPLLREFNKEVAA